MSGKVAFEEHSMLKEKRSKSLKSKKREKVVEEGDISSLLKKKVKGPKKPKNNLIKNLDLDSMDQDYFDEYSDYDY